MGQHTLLKNINFSVLKYIDIHNEWVYTGHISLCFATNDYVMNLRKKIISEMFKL